MRIASATTAFVALTLAMATVLIAPTAQAAGNFTVTDVGTLVGSGDGQFDDLVNTQSGAINQDGVVAAVAYAPDGTWAVPFTSTDGEVVLLGKDDEYSYAFDINDKGGVVGYSTSREDTQFANLAATVWRAGKPKKLPTLGGERSQAGGINNNGEIVGNSAIAPGDNTIHAVLWRDDKPIDLGTLGGTFSYAQKINNNSVVVGFSFTEGNAGQAPFVWQDGEMTALSLRDGFNGAAYGINDDGLVVGGMYRTVDSVTEFYAVSWVEGERQRLPSLIDEGQGNAFTADSAGRIVGWSALSDQGMMDPAAVIWEGDKLTDLNTLIPEDSGYRLTMAQSINDKGQIVASASSESDAFAHSVVLNPVDETASRIGTELLRVPAAALKQ